MNFINLQKRIYIYVELQLLVRENEINRHGLEVVIDKLIIIDIISNFENNLYPFITK